MVPAVTREPSQGLHQFRSQLYAARIDLEAALENFAPATDNIEKAAGGPCVEYVAALILDFFETAFPALFAAAVPITLFDR